jgi:predicted alpha-1,2-mannosidase
MALMTALSCAPPAKDVANSVAKQVDVFIGTTVGGNLHPGATTPFGMIALSPHTETQDWINMGYNHADSFVIGFVHNQVSGIGCAEYGNFLVMPARNSTTLENFGYKSPRTNERGKPGYYATWLTKPNVQVELTATARTAHHRYTFKQNAKGDTLKLFFNMSHCSFPQKPKHSEANIDNDGMVCGVGMIDGGFGSEPSEMQAFFSAKPSKKPDFIAVYKLSNKQSEIRSDLQAIQAGEGEECGAILGWIANKDEEEIELTSAISYKSFQNSDNYIRAIEEKRTTFNRIAAQVETAWNELLSKIQVQGGSESERTLFYTALYRMCLMPTDITGETPDSFKATGKAFTNYFAIWDTYRTQNPFFTLWLASLQKDLLNSLLDIADNRGWLPDGFTGNALTPIQGGTNADVLFADAAVKKLQGVDYERAFKYVMKNATDTTGDKPNINARKGRFPEYLQQGFLYADKQWVSVSKSLEYAYNDYCVYALANAIGKGDSAKFALERASKVFELFDTTTGFFRPKRSNGTWVEPFKPTMIFPEGQVWSYEVHYYEGSAWQYLGYVPHDFYRLIALLGGKEKFIAKWDTMLTNRDKEGYFTIWNEPDMLAVWQYIYAGKADRVQLFTRDILKRDFRVAPDGYKGNDDSGTLSAWYVWASIGLFPNAGQDWYFVGSPVFTKVVMKLENGNALVINAPNASEKNVYVKSLKLNGVPIERAWLRHSEIANGATLDFEMSDTPTDWGSRELPPTPLSEKIQQLN